LHAEKLGIYLNDHLAGATFGVGLARRIADQHRQWAYGAELERVAEEIAQDRRNLLEIMDSLGVPARRYKICAGWAAERVGRLKPNGVLYRRSGLSTVVELETMRLGVEGKTLVWRSLLVVATGEERLDEPRLQSLLSRARDQIDTLEALRLRAVAGVFSSEAHR
jgi:hypothetical protein